MGKSRQELEAANPVHRKQRENKYMHACYSAPGVHFIVQDLNP